MTGSEQRAPKCCLIAFIDDASGQVLAARFFDTEPTQGYLGLLHEYVGAHGLPAALYSDRHGIFTKSDPEDPKPTQFERALVQLDIKGICAHTPQAKGRVERLFQTLQDRMVKAMRLQAITGIEAANAWLPGYLREHNAQFAVAPASPADAHRPWLGTPDCPVRRWTYRGALLQPESAPPPLYRQRTPQNPQDRR